MAGRSSNEREYALLVAELGALGEDIATARVAAQRGAHPSGPHLGPPHDAPARPSGERVRLADGAEVVIRPVEPGDRHGIDVGFQHLSAVSRLRALRQPLEHLTARQLTDLTGVDHVSQEVMVAFAPEDGECIGAARFARSPDDPAQAEFTCTVADRWHGRGVGTALVERLAARARALGVERFTVVVLVDDEAARRLVRRVARTVTEHREGGTIRMSGRADEDPS